MPDQNDQGLTWNRTKENDEPQRCQCVKLFTLDRQGSLYREIFLYKLFEAV